MTNYQSVLKHERIAKLMRFIEEHPGLRRLAYRCIAPFRRQIRNLFVVMLK